MAATTTLTISHLNGFQISYRLSSPSSLSPSSLSPESSPTIDPSYPTLILINSLCTTASLFDPQFFNPHLTSTMNLLAIKPLGQGATSTKAEEYTYWDSATAIVQVMDAFGVEKAFLCGTSQGGWIGVRVALVAPEKIQAILLLGISLDSESPDSLTHGCWDPVSLLQPFLDSWISSVPTPDFVIDDLWCERVCTLGFGVNVSEETEAFWTETMKGVYRDDEGRRKVIMAVRNLMERDGLLLRLGEVRAPVWWMQGSDDLVYGTKLAEEQIKLFTNSRETRFEIVQGGGHFLNATDPREVDDALLELVKRFKDWQIPHAAMVSTAEVLPEKAPEGRQN